MIRWNVFWTAALGASFAFGCGGDGGTGGRAASGENWSQVVAAQGTPTFFSVECTRHAWDPATELWQPQPGFVRTDLWVYAGTPARVYALVNGEVIGSRTSDEDYGAYPNPGIDPRIVGCGEEPAIVAEAVGGTSLLTTAGSDVASVLDLGTVQLLVDYYTVTGGRSGLLVVYANGKMVGMETL